MIERLSLAAMTHRAVGDSSDVVEQLVQRFTGSPIITELDGPYGAEFEADSQPERSSACAS